MAEDWSIDVKKYAPDADDNVIAAIVRHCGIALRNRDSSLVSFTDTAETDLVRESYCKKKLGITDPDSVIDAAIAKVGEIMKADHTKNRVTVYYLLAEAFGKLGIFGAVAAAAAPVAAAVAAPVAAAVVEPVAAPRVAPLAAVPEVAAAGSMRWLWWLLGLLALAGLLWWLLRPKPEEVVVAEVTEAVVPAAPVAAPVEAVPDGAGITAQEVEGKPEVSVYFDTAKTDIYPNFDARTEAVRKYAADHPGSTLQVSGYNDPRGDAAMNAELSKNRAFAVRDALVKLGVPEASINLVKPVDTTDDTDSLARARRVDITVVDAQ